MGHPWVDLRRFLGYIWKKFQVVCKNIRCH